jgi:hypothetical protein
MDERQLQQQIEQTGDLMDVLHNPSILAELIQIEEEHEGDIGAGFPAYTHDPKPVTPKQVIAMRRQVRLQSIVLSELAEMIERINLGVGREAAIVESRRRIRQRLGNLTGEQQIYFDALVDEDQLQTENKPIRAELKSVLRGLLSQADWDDIGRVATESIQAQWTEYFQTSQSA